MHHLLPRPLRPDAGHGTAAPPEQDLTAKPTVAPGSQEEEKANNAQRQEEKEKIAHWEERKATLSPDDAASDPNDKALGQSSKQLRGEDFELLKTLGTGEYFAIVRLRASCSVEY